MNENVKVVFGLIGGLALFLYGMNSMSDALQKAAGEKMKKILEFLTKNPIMGALAGALVTAVLQSSSATTVMVIGFVSAGLMSLPQAISVIFGANIGTTMTAQLMAFKISDYIYPLIFIGFMLNFLGKKEKVKNLGAVMTLVVQSSSATIAVLQSFASQAGPDGVSSVIGLTGAIPILLGDNIGTTITALLASIGQSKDAKRTAIAHSFFNITGTCVFIWIIPWFAQFVRYISPKGNEIDVVSRQIANAHTTFNVVCTLVWLPLIPIMVKIVTTIIRGEDKNTGVVYEPKYLDNKVIDQPVAAMYLVSQELENLAGFSVHMLNSLKGSLNQKKTSAAYEKFKNQLDIVQHLQEEITDYITKLFSSGNLTELQSEQTAGLLYVTNNIERIADRCQDIDSIWIKIQDDGMSFSEEAGKEIENCINVLLDLLRQAMTAVKEGSEEEAELVFKNKKKLHKAEKKFNKAHLNRVKNQKCDPAMTGCFSGILYNLDRAADNCVSIAEEALDNQGFVKLGEAARNFAAPTAVVKAV